MRMRSDGSAPPTGRAEWLSFLVLTLIVLPALAVIFVGGYGFVIWMSQIINGPPVVKF